MGVIAALASGLLVDGSMLADLRSGSSVEGQDPSAAAISADLQGRLSDGGIGLKFGLEPSAVLAQSSRVFARGFGQVDLRLDETAWAHLKQGLGYGTVDLSPVGPGGAPAGTAVQPPPTSRFVLVQESSTSLDLDVRASRRLRLAGSAAWMVSGGADAAGRLALPLARGPQVRALLDWLGTPLDAIHLEAAGSDTRYSNQRRASVASFTAGWRTRPSRATELSLSLGPGIGRAQLADQQPLTVAYVVAAADLRSTFTPALAASIGGSVEPVGDALSGEVVERGSARASVTLGRPGGLTASARLIGSLTLTSGGSAPSSPQAGDRFWQGELSAGLPIDSRSSLAAGIRGALFSRPLPGQPDQQWAAFVSYAARLALLR